MQHVLKASSQTVHWGYYDGRLRPVLRIRSGDSVEVETVSGDPKVLEAHGISPSAIPEALVRIHNELKDRGPGPHILNGPIFIEGAKPHDVLEVRLKEIRPMVPFAYNLFMPGFGTLPEDFPYAKARVIKLDLSGQTAEVRPGLSVPLGPFFGQLGVAPPAYHGRIDSRPPGFHGGNIDNKELTAGATLYLPIHVEGALFSVGDGHSAQGDGEVDLTAIETCMRGILELRVRSDLRLNWPMAETATSIISMGFHADLDEAAKMALRNMLDYLTSQKGLDRGDAYALSSVALDLHVTQLVNGVKGIHGILPKAVLKHA